MGKVYSKTPEENLVPKFWNMKLGDVTKITVLKEMEKLKMTRDKPLDLSLNKKN